MEKDKPNAESSSEQPAFTLRLPSDEYEWLAALAEREHRTIRNQVRHILAEYRRQTEQKP
jgi:hypothetical protein